jgi:threonine aldolase
LKKTVDLRSDTVTRPTPEMLEAIMGAEVGDDVFGDDPTTLELERYGAALLGKEAALFCASGTMSNQIAINVHTQPGDEVICHEDAHIYRYEGGGIARNSGASVRLLSGNSGRFSAQQLEDEINPDDQHYPVTRLVSIEDTANRGGGVFYDPEETTRIAAFCRENKLKFHLDGARLFNALVETGVSPKVYGQYFDSISICLSKGLGAPQGTLLLGDKAFIKQARRVRKAFGGGMRQTGYMAAGGLFALKNNIERLKEDHRRARQLESALKECNWVASVLPVQTNIVVVNLQPAIDQSELLFKLDERGIRAIGFGKGRIRMVTHLDIDDEDIDFVADILKKIIY